MNVKLIEMTGKAIADKNSAKNFAKVNRIAAPLGYIVEPEACTKDVLDFLEQQNYNPNSTFYKEWNDILSKDRFDLALDQIMHYMTTYGAKSIGLDIEGNGYVHNDNPVKLDFKAYKIIKACSEKEIFESLMDMLRAGVALKTDTIDLIVEYCEEYKFLDNINLDEIKNKEAQVLLSIKLNRLPIDPIGMIRCIMYNYTNSTMIIKSKEIIKTIKNRPNMFNFNSLNESQLVKLAANYRRFKPLFLAMKTKENASVINKLNRLAKTYHKPMVTPFWNDILSNKKDLSVIKENLAELDNFRKVVLLQSIQERLTGKNLSGKSFIIRNGKQYVRENYKSPCDVSYLMSLYSTIESSLVESLKGKSIKDDGTAKTFSMGMLNVMAPTSEKNFVGNFSMGSYIELPKNGYQIIGIYWRNEWSKSDYEKEHTDLDLHYYDVNGLHYGWCSSYYNDETTVTYSGDMTDANPEASECYLIKGSAPDGRLAVRNFAGGETKFKLYAASSASDIDIYTGYMVDSKDIIFEANIEINDDSKTIAKLSNNRMYFVNLGTGYGRMPNSNLNDIVQQQMANKLESFIPLKDLLLKAGFVETTENADIDFCSCGKDDILNLFA